jgi:hypothetical protein
MALVAPSPRLALEAALDWMDQFDASGVLCIDIQLVIRPSGVAMTAFVAIQEPGRESLTH